MDSGKIAQIFKDVRQRMEADPAKYRHPPIKLCWRIEGAGAWMVDSSAEPPVRELAQGQFRNGIGCELAISGADFLEVWNGAASLQQIFLAGRLQMAGSWQEALKVSIFVDTVLAERGAAG